jgi:N4-gp56 family major capsid protein
VANSISIDALRQELWAKELLEDVIKDVQNVMKFMGTDDNNVVKVNKDLKTMGGDTETFGLIARLAGDGVTGDDELEGNEESMLSYSQSVAIDQIRNAVRLRGKLDAQKTVYDQIKSAREVLRIWMKEFYCRQILLKMAGVTNTFLVDTNGKSSSGRATWSNTPAFIADADTAAGTGNRYICAETTGAANLAAADILTLDIITNAATKAKLANPKIQPLTGDGEDFYVMYVHPLCARDLRKSSDWKTAQQNARQRSDNNPVFRGAIGYWSNVLILENEFVPWLNIVLTSTGATSNNSFRGVSTGTDYGANCAANILCGRQAVLMAEASEKDALVVEQFDYKNKDGVACNFMGGIQKTLFNSVEFATIQVDAAAAV